MPICVFLRWHGDTPDFSTIFNWCLIIQTRTRKFQDTNQVKVSILFRSYKFGMKIFHGVKYFVYWCVNRCQLATSCQLSSWQRMLYSLNWYYSRNKHAKYGVLLYERVPVVLVKLIYSFTHLLIYYFCIRCVLLLYVLTVTKMWNLCLPKCCDAEYIQYIYI